MSPLRFNGRSNRMLHDAQPVKAQRLTVIGVVGATIGAVILAFGNIRARTDLDVSNQEEGEIDAGRLDRSLPDVPIGAFPRREALIIF